MNNFILHSTIMQSLKRIAAASKLVGVLQRSACSGSIFHNEDFFKTKQTTQQSLAIGGTSREALLKE